MAVWNVIKRSEIPVDRMDAEFFRKDYRNYERLLYLTSENLKFNKIFKYIHRGTQPNYNKNGDIRVLRSVNVGALIFNETRQKHVTYHFYSKNVRGQVKLKDILITSTGVGTLGRTSIWYFSKPAFCDGHITILRYGKVDPYFISIYLNSKYGLYQFDKHYRGSSGQIEIYPYDIAKFLVPKFLFDYQKEIGDKARRAFQLRQQSQSLYQEAEELFEKELGLDQVIFDEPLSYTANFSGVVQNNRADAEFYQPKYNQIEELLNKLKWTYLKSIILINKGIEVGSKKYVENGVNFIRVSNITKFGFNFGHSDKYISDSTYLVLQEFQPQIDDILLTKDGTVGISYVVDEFVKGVVSSGILILKNKNEDIPKEYLSLVINSKICQMQIEQDCSGALISHWKISDVYKLRIPILDTKIMQKINELVVESKKLKKQSQQLLEEAKQKVEKLIEKEAAKKGIDIPYDPCYNWTKI